MTTSDMLGKKGAGEPVRDILLKSPPQEDHPSIASYRLGQFVAKAGWTPWTAIDHDH